MRIQFCTTSDYIWQHKNKIQNYSGLFLSFVKELQRRPSRERIVSSRILGTRKPGGLPSMGSHRVGHDWSDLAAAASPVAYWKLSDLGEFIWYQVFLPSHILHRVLPERTLEWVANSCSNGSSCVRTFHYDLSILGDVPAMAHSFIAWLKMSYASSFTTTRLWSMKGNSNFSEIFFPILSDLSRWKF